MHKFKNADIAILILRLFVAAVFIFHGVMKLMNIETTELFFQIAGLPTILATIVSVTEVVAGILMLLGFLTSVSAIAIIALMIMAFLNLKAPTLGFNGFQLQAAMLVSALVIVLTGSGKYSLGKHCGCVGGCQCDSKMCNHGMCKIGDNCGCNCHTGEKPAEKVPAQNHPEHNITI